MRLSSRLVPALAVLSFTTLSLGSPAQADLIIQPLRFDTLPKFNTTITGSTISQFDPALGTLNSVKATLPVTFTFSSGDFDAHQVQYRLGLGTLTLYFDSVFYGDGTLTQVLEHAYNTTSVLDLVTGTGVLTPSIRAYSFSNPTANFEAIFGDGSVTYDYTPRAVSVPEPASLALLGSALAGLGLIRRRRRLGNGA